MVTIAASRRVRRTPFSSGVEAAGVKAYTVYNHMLLPTAFESIEADEMTNGEDEMANGEYGA